MPSSADLRVLFRAPAGPRRGFGHLVRCRSLARALGVRPRVALRGGRAAEEAAAALGCDVVRGSATRLLEALAPDVLVIDDPIAADAQAWVTAARRAGCLVASVHDLGIGRVDSDVVIDGSLTKNARARRGTTLAGPRFAVLDPSAADDGPPRDPDAVLVALGGGPRARLAIEIAEAIVAAHPHARVRVAGGFMSPAAGVHHRITATGPLSTLHVELSRAAVAVVGGGMSLYEACAHGTPAVAVPVVDAQRPTVRAFVARGAARGVVRGPVRAGLVAAACVTLLADLAMQRRLSRTGRYVIDGRGALRAAAVLRRLAAQKARG